MVIIEDVDLVTSKEVNLDINYVNHHITDVSQIDWNKVYPVSKVELYDLVYNETTLFEIAKLLKLLKLLKL